MVEADITMIPQNWVELTDEEAIKKMQRILDLLDEDDDVQAVYHNWDRIKNRDCVCCDPLSPELY